MFSINDDRTIFQNTFTAFNFVFPEPICEFQMILAQSKFGYMHMKFSFDQNLSRATLFSKYT